VRLSLSCPCHLLTFKFILLQNLAPTVSHSCILFKIIALMDSGQARRCAVARARRRHMGVVPSSATQISVPCRRARVCVYCIGNHDNAALNGAIGTASALRRVIAHEETIAALTAFTPAVAQFAHCARRPRARVQPGLEGGPATYLPYVLTSIRSGVSLVPQVLPVLRTELTPPARQVDGGGGIVTGTRVLELDVINKKARRGGAKSREYGPAESRGAMCSRSSSWGASGRRTHAWVGGGTANQAAQAVARAGHGYGRAARVDVDLGAVGSQRARGEAEGSAGAYGTDGMR
ncbi:hypothetical protein B0H11DRAFT_2308204, partial [Mycena galericulata]